MTRESSVERWENWSGSVSTEPSAIYYPETEEDLVDIVERHAPGETIRAVGAGHSFTRLGETEDVLVSMEEFTGVVSVDEDARQATVRAGTRLEEMNQELAEHGLAMENMGDIDQQRLAGATSTGTHGTGVEFGILATQIAEMRLVTADGEVVTCSPERDHDLFKAAQVSLGALGLISTITLDLLPAYDVRMVKTPMGLEEVLSRLEELRAENRHFEFFWYPGDDVARVKTINETDRARPSLRNRAIEGLRGLSKRIVPASVRYGFREYTNLVFEEVDVGPSHEVFPSVRDIRFNEMEYGLPREAGPEAMGEIADLVRSRDDVTFPVEFRYVKGDDVFLSPAYGRDSAFIAVHKYHEKPYEEFFARAEAIFEGYDGRPHWGKHHSLTAEELAPRYPRWDAFQDARRDLDPEGVFLNDYLREVLGA